MTHFDLIIIGTGSGNSIPGPAFDHWSIAIVEDNLFGGTCTNVGCIPTKMYVYPADLAEGTRHAAALGVNAHVDSVDWPAIRDRVFGRIDAIEAGGRAYRSGPECPNITVFEGRAEFSGTRALRVHRHDGGTSEITADRIVLAAGARAIIPDVPGLAGTPFHTSDTIMRIDTQPERLAVIGGGYIAAEFGHIFASLGTQVVQIIRGESLLSKQDDDISAAFTAYVQRRYDLRTQTVIERVEHSPAGFLLHLRTPAGVCSVAVDAVLVATGRQPNGDRLNLGATGVELDDEGRVEVDEYQQTACPGIYALGDVSSHYQLKHVANHEARIVAHNLAHPEQRRKADHRFVPAAVFTEPQVATVGVTERQAIRDGLDYIGYTQQYADIAAGWAREDKTGFLKVLADRATGKLLGAHVIGPEAATVIQPLIQAMSFGQTAREVATGQYWIHPALPEVVENALLGLPQPTGISAA